MWPYKASHVTVKTDMYITCLWYHEIQSAIVMM